MIRGHDLRVVVIPPALTPSHPLPVHPPRVLRRLWIKTQAARGAILTGRLTPAYPENPYAPGSTDPRRFLGRRPKETRGFSKGCRTPDPREGDVSAPGPETLGEVNGMWHFAPGGFDRDDRVAMSVDGDESFGGDRVGDVFAGERLCMRDHRGARSVERVGYEAIRTALGACECGETERDEVSSALDRLGCVIEVAPMSFRGKSSAFTSRGPPVPGRRAPSPRVRGNGSRSCPRRSRCTVDTGRNRD